MLPTRCVFDSLSFLPHFCTCFPTKNLNTALLLLDPYPWWITTTSISESPSTCLRHDLHVVYASRISANQGTIHCGVVPQNQTTNEDERYNHSHSITPMLLVIVACYIHDNSPGFHPGYLPECLVAASHNTISYPSTLSVLLLCFMVFRYYSVCN